MKLHPGWACVILLLTPVVYVVGLSAAVQFLDFPRTWALGAILASTPLYVTLALKVAPPEEPRASQRVPIERAQLRQAQRRDHQLM